MLKLGKSASEGKQKFSALFLKRHCKFDIVSKAKHYSYILKYLHFNSEILVLFNKQESLS